jgi:hypothetical protein
VHVQDNVAAAVTSLKDAVQSVYTTSNTDIASGVIRLEVPVPASFTALQWLLAQCDADDCGDEIQAYTATSVYFSPRSAPYPATDMLGSKPSVAGAPVGMASAMPDVHVFLSCLSIDRVRILVMAAGKHEAFVMQAVAHLGYGVAHLDSVWATPQSHQCSALPVAQTIACASSVGPASTQTRQCRLSGSPLELTTCLYQP